MTTEYEDENAVQYRRRRRRPSVWKDGREYFWNPNENRYERWITIGKRRICETYDGLCQIPPDMTPKERESLLQFAINTNNEALYLNLTDFRLPFSKPKEGEPEISLFQEPNPIAPVVKSAAECIEIIERANFEKNRESGTHFIQTLNERRQRHANELNQLMVWKRNKSRIEKELAQGKKTTPKGVKILSDEDILELNKEFEIGVSLEKRIGERVNTERVSRIVNWDKYVDILKLLLPNRGGKELLNEQFKNMTKKMFKKHGVEIIAKEVIEVYNAVGRCYNLKGRDVEQPTVIFETIPNSEEGEEVYGYYENKKIVLNKAILDRPHLVRLAFAHELGHWLETEVCRMRRNNVIWLQNKQGPLVEIIVVQKNGQIKKYSVAPFEKHPQLCADDYAQRVYDNGTELISIAMQEFVVDPETFVRRCPDHFNLLLDNFREI